VQIDWFSQNEAKDGDIGHVSQQAGLGKTKLEKILHRHKLKLPTP
jgi:hypothetical protein